MAMSTALLGTAVKPRRVGSDELPEDIVRQLYDYDYRIGESLENLYLIFDQTEEFLPANITVLRHEYLSRIVVSLISAEYSHSDRGWLCVYGVECEAD